MTIVRCPTEASTFDLGQRIGRLAAPGTVIGLAGDLGAGKTVFAKGLGKGLDVQTRVVSPTFILVAVHEGRLTLWHADLYRLEAASELDDLGLEEAAQGVLVVEWFERFPDALPDDRLEVYLSFEGQGRRATLTATGAQHQALLEALGDR